jgi:hypothetical protein
MIVKHKIPAKNPGSSLGQGLLLGLAMILPSLLWAEGAVRILECDVASTCNARLACTPATGQFTFRMEPQSLDNNNAGTYLLSHDEVQAEMQALSYAGPFHWRTPGTMHTLLASSETDFLWHSLELAAEPVTTIRYMACRFIQ